jgi:hypothetical protein
MFMHQMLSERTRDAVRWGASHAFDQTTIQNVVLYGAPTPPTGATALFGLSTSNVAVTRQAGAAGEPDTLRIQVTGWSYPILSPYIARTVIAPDIDTFMTMENP